MKAALLFPGQGSQFLGMGAEIASTNARASEFFGEAADILGYDLRPIIFGNDAELLRRTDITQPAIYLISALYGEEIAARQIPFDYVAGHSLGEYSALYSAGVFSFKEGLKLVQKRGLFMAQAGREELSMAAIMGLDKKQVEENIAQYHEHLEIANENSKYQIVISGRKKYLEIVAREMEETQGAKVTFLNVSSAFHSRFMTDARESMRPLIMEMPFNEPVVPVISNVTARPTRDIDDIKNFLIDQIAGMVRWFETISFLKSAGVETCYEVGPGEVLKKLTKTISASMKCVTVKELL